MEDRWTLNQVRDDIGENEGDIGGCEGDIGLVVQGDNEVDESQDPLQP